MRGLGLVRRQPRLFQYYRHGLRFGAAVGGGDRGAQDRLRQYALGKFQKWLRLRRDIDADVIGPVIRGLANAHGRAAFQPVEIMQQRLSDHPLRRAVDLAGRRLESIAGCLVKPDTERGGHHVDYPP